MQTAVAVKNAAFFYHPDGFNTNRQDLMGRHAAGEGFVQGFAAHSGAETLYCYAETKAHFEEFAELADRYCKSKTACRWIPWTRWQQLSDVGCLLMPGPDLSDVAWQRRHGNQRAFSIVGVTHTTASARIMDGLGELLTAPLQPWDAIVCTSHSVKKMIQRVVSNQSAYLKDRFGLATPPMPAAQFPVIPLGVHCAAFDPPADTRATLRRQWRETLDIRDDDFVALFVGRLSFHAKAHPMPMYLGLEQAAQRLSTNGELSGKKIHLIQAGWFANDSIKKEFVEGAKAFCPSITVHFVDGRLPDVRQSIWYAADVFTSLSDNIQETFGLTPIEAMAAGLPVVVSDWDGYKETVRDGVDGFRVRTIVPPPGLASDLALAHAMGITNYDRYIGYQSQFTAVDVEGSARAFERLIEDPALRAQIGAAGRERARLLFDWSRVVRGYQQLWEELSELRPKAEEICPRALNAPAHPLRDDPTSIFAHYPTETLGAETQIYLSEDASAERVKEIQAFAMNTVGKELVYQPREMGELLAVLSADKPLTLEKVCAGVASAQGRSLLYTLTWLAKMGQIRLEPGIEKEAEASPAEANGKRGLESPRVSEVKRGKSPRKRGKGKQ